MQHMYKINHDIQDPIDHKLYGAFSHDSEVIRFEKAELRKAEKKDRREALLWSSAFVVLGLITAYVSLHIELWFVH